MARTTKNPLKNLLNIKVDDTMRKKLNVIRDYSNISEMIRGVLNTEITKKLHELYRQGYITIETLKELGE